MKVFISIDMEGIGGIVGERETDPNKGGEAYQANRRLMTQEGNAAIEGCLRAGAKDILIADSHWNFDNLIPEEVHEAATLLRGHPRPFSMVHDLDGSFDAAMFIGYHAKAGTPRAILDHTYTGRIAAVQVNGVEVGETGINAYLAGHHGVPVVMVTGDSAVTAEAKALIPRVHTVAVKEATGASAAKNLHPKRARDLIRVEAAQALRDRKAVRPLRAKTPVEMEVTLKGTESADRAEMIPTARRIGGTRIEFGGNDYVQAFRTFYAIVTISSDG